MAKWKNLVKRLPRFSVRDLLVVFTCCSIGFATQHSWVESIASCFLAIECWRQARFFRQQLPSENDVLRNGRLWAILARYFCASLLAMIIVFQGLLNNEVVVLPEHDDLWMQWMLPIPLYLIIILATFLTCRSELTRVFRRNFISLFKTMMAIILLGFVVSQELLGTYLVHRATEGTEHSRPLRLQRPGVYPNHASELFFTTWMGFAALLLMLVAALLLISISRRYKAKQKFPKKLCAAYIATLIAAFGYVVWYYCWEFLHISPDLASAGLVANWVDWLGGGLIVVAAAMFGAAALSNANEWLTDGDNELRKRNFVQPGLFGLLAVCTMLLALILFAWSFVDQFILQPPVWSGISPPLMLRWSLSEPEYLLMLATFLVAAQIAWHWLRSGAPKICIGAIDSKAYCFNFCALIALICLGIPLFAAFGFSFWLGPWKLF